MTATARTAQLLLMLTSRVSRLVRGLLLLLLLVKSVVEEEEEEEEGLPDFASVSLVVSSVNDFKGSAKRKRGKGQKEQKDEEY